MSKLASPQFQVKVEINEVCLKSLSNEDEGNMFWNFLNKKFKVKVTTMNTSSGERTIKEASNYHLTNDKVMRKIVSKVQLCCSRVICFEYG